jgi:hypothetical protein
MATLYYNAAVDTDWATLGNWWTDINHTIPAASLPTSIDSVVLSEECNANSGSAPTVFNLTMPTTSSAGIGISISVTGMAVFYGGTYIWGTFTGNPTFNEGSGNTGTINGNATFNDNSYNGQGFGGIVTGDATFNGSSSNYGNVNENAVFNDTSYNLGTVTGTATFNDASYSSVESSIGTTVLGTRTPSPLRFGINNSNILGMI